VKGLFDDTFPQNLNLENELKWIKIVPNPKPNDACFVGIKLVLSKIRYFYFGQ